VRVMIPGVAVPPAETKMPGLDESPVYLALPLTDPVVGLDWLDGNEHDNARPRARQAARLPAQKHGDSGSPFRVWLARLESRLL
jgi:hypothetical protein